MPYLNCSYCNKVFKVTKKYIYYKNYRQNKFNIIEKSFCKRRCKDRDHSTGYSLRCNNCNKTLYIKNCIYKKSKTKNFFCNKSCAAKYNNTHKKTGTRTSKLEKFIRQRLVLEYTNLNILFNNKETINSELDIYIPSLNLAFELNGIFHYEPIYGKELLKKIKNNDKRKFQACLDKNIELCIIDTSHQTYFSEKTSNKFLNIIKTIINQKLSAGRDLNPHGDYSPEDFKSSMASVTSPAGTINPVPIPPLK